MVRGMGDELSGRRRVPRCGTIRDMKIELPESLTGEGVVLRRLRPDDGPVYVAAFSADPDLGRLLGMEEDPTEAAIRERAASLPERAAEGRLVELAVSEPDDDAFLGTVILHSFDWPHRRCEVGFWLVPEARGRGVGSRAVALAVSWALGQLDLLRVEMTTTPDNEAIFALARRLGFTHEGVLRKRNVERGVRVDVVWFGVLREEWARR
jgi:RimJ/RimL family protein N-acetyltransferase